MCSDDEVGGDLEALNSLKGLKIILIHIHDFFFV